MNTQLRAVFRASLPYAAALAMGLVSSLAHADRGTSPETAAQDLQQHPTALSGSASQPAPALTGNETPPALLKLR